MERDLRITCLKVQCTISTFYISCLASQHGVICRFEHGCQFISSLISVAFLDTALSLANDISGATHLPRHCTQLINRYTSVTQTLMCVSAAQLGTKCKEIYTAACEKRILDSSSWLGKGNTNTKELIRNRHGIWLVSKVQNTYRLAQMAKCPGSESIP